MGNTIDRANQHSLRMWHANSTIISHNAIGGSSYDNIRHAIKIHSAGVQNISESISATPTPSSTGVVISYNQIGATTNPGSWTCGFGPQNADPGTVEGLQDFILEYNTFIRGPNTSQEAVWRGRRMTQRGNTLQGGGTASIVATVLNLRLRQLHKKRLHLRFVGETFDFFEPGQAFGVVSRPVS